MSGEIPLLKIPGHPPRYPEVEPVRSLSTGYIPGAPGQPGIV